MGHDALLVTPQPRDDQVFAIGGGEVAESVDTPLDAQEAASLDVVVEQRAGVSSIGGLGRGEVPVLGRSERVEGCPSRFRHAEMLSQAERLCKAGYGLSRTQPHLICGFAICMNSATFSPSQTGPGRPRKFYRRMPSPTTHFGPFELRFGGADCFSQGADLGGGSGRRVEALPRFWAVVCSIAGRPNGGTRWRWFGRRPVVESPEPAQKEVSQLRPAVNTRSTVTVSS